ncbi:ABC transporter permease [uncultured Kordia sp.]|uniref:ABC transporter permease n=1 Tax=uncultured Kordia sp. TaxID=507699 RepID=UPI00261EC5F9|nr:ABC transporter permease [uncultured Kordia sp.]
MNFIKSYFKTAIRNLSKNRLHSFINIFGLSVSIAVSILILKYVSFQYSYDNFNTNLEDISRVGIEFNQENGSRIRSAVSYHKLGPTLVSENSEVLDYVRLISSSGIIKYEETSFNEKEIYYTDASFFSIFSYPLIKGDANTIFNQPNTVVISKKAADKYFKGEDPLGKIFKFEDENYKVEGVIDVPNNSHLYFDFLFPIKKLLAPGGDYDDVGWEDADFYTYVQLAPKVEVTSLTTRINAMYSKYCKGQGCENSVFIQPVKDIHLHSDLEFEASVNVDNTKVNILILLAFFILIVSWVNYISLSTASMMNRAKEIGIRMIMGAKRKQLVFQFMFEFILINFIALLIALVLAYIGSSLITEKIGIYLPDNVWGSAFFWIVALAVIIVGAIISSIYPSIILSSVTPVAAVSGKVKSSVKGRLLRKGLTIVQFVFSGFLIVGSYTMYKQMSYMENMDIGMNIDQMIVLKVPMSGKGYRKGLIELKNEIRNYSGIKNVTASSLVPGEEYNFVSDNFKKSNSDATITAQVMLIDSDYPEVYEMDVIEGADFFEGEGRTGIMLNEALAGLLEIGSIYNNKETLTFAGRAFEIAAISKNYYQHTAKSAPDPIAFICLSESNFTPKFLSAKVATNNVEETLAYMENKWNVFFPDSPFEFYFLDDFYNQQYKESKQMITLFSLFTLLAIIISSLGLLGLTVFAAQQRTKEIAIRKVLGAKVSTILYFFLRDTVILVFIATLIITPLVYYGLGNWLEGFAARITIQWWWIIISSIIILLIAFIVMSYHVLKAAYTNPIESLKYE